MIQRDWGGCEEGTKETREGEKTDVEEHYKNGQREKGKLETDGRTPRQMKAAKERAEKNRNGKTGEKS